MSLFSSRLLSLTALTTVTLLGMSASVKAAPITYLFTGIGSGTLGATPFTDAVFTITALADTDNIDFITFGADTPVVQSSSTTISITGLPTATFNTAKRIFNNQTANIVGVNDLALNDIFNIRATAPALSTYTLATAFGPLTTDSSGTTLGNVGTNLGTLSLTRDNETATFQAITEAPSAAAPEPGSVALLCVGLLGMAGTLAVRRRHSKVGTAG